VIDDFHIDWSRENPLEERNLLWQREQARALSPDDAPGDGVPGDP
jgi:hypothetical protein